VSAFERRSTPLGFQRVRVLPDLRCKVEKRCDDGNRSGKFAYRAYRLPVHVIATITLNKESSADGLYAGRVCCDRRERCSNKPADTF
jgi:hypothetical protein